MTDSNLQVLAERTLLQNKVLAELPKAADAQGGPKFLHIMAKQADIESVNLTHAPCILQVLREGELLRNKVLAKLSGGG